MKQFLTSLICSANLFGCSVSASMATTVVEVAVMSDAKKRPEVASIINDAIFAGKKGDAVTVYDVQGGRRIATIIISEEVANQPVNSNAKVIWLNKKNGGELAALKTYFAAPASDGTGDVVRWMKGLEQRKNEFPGASIKAVFFGSPLISTPEAYAMQHRWPSDGFITQPDALFSAVGKESSLRGFELHIVHSPGLTEFSDRNRDFHAQKIKTFYGRMIARMGGNLASFGGTSNHLKNITTATFPKQNYGELEGGSKPVVYEVLSPKLVKEDGDRQQSLWASAVDKNPLVAPVGAQPFDLGLTWDKNVDLDIYVLPTDDMELFYGQTHSRKYAGRFLKDIRTTPENRGFETVVYENPVPLKSLKVFINHYSGHSIAPINAEFRLRVNGQIYSKKFQIPAGSGTGGQGNRRANPAWLEINIPALLGMNA